MSRRALLVAALLLVAPMARAQQQAAGGDPQGVVGLPKGQAFAGEALLARTEDVAGLLRCPVCQGLSVADSPSKLAGEMRSEIETQLRAGRSPDRIRAFFIDRYGEWILLSPSRHGWNLLPWAVPIVGLLAGVTVWVVFVRRRAPRIAGEVTETEHRRIEHGLADLEEPG